MPRYVQLTGVTQRLAVLAAVLGRYVTTSRAYIFVNALVMAVIGRRVVTAVMRKWSRLVFGVAGKRVATVQMLRRSYLTAPIAASRAVVAGLIRRFRLAASFTGQAVVSMIPLRLRGLSFSATGQRTVTAGLRLSTPICDAAGLAITDSSGASITGLI